ncbi:hypothetical protein V6N13_042873 [Hibiscus sabdariffa]
MLRPKHLWFSCLALTLSLSPDVSDARPCRSNNCDPSMCGNVETRWPFRLKSQPLKCGERWYEIECKRNRTVSLPMKYGNFYVMAISYVNQTIRIVDTSLVDGNCSIPRTSFPSYSYYFQDTIDWYRADIMYTVNCTTTMNSSVYYVDASRCGTNSSSSPWTYFYFSGSRSNISDFHESCRFVAQFPFQLSNTSGLSTSDIYRNLLKGVDVSWYTPETYGPSNLILKVNILCLFGNIRLTASTESHSRILSK